MTLLSTKIAEVIDELLSTEDECLIWRGVLNTQPWKIVVHRKIENPYRVTVHAEKRRPDEEEPE